MTLTIQNQSNHNLAIWSAVEKTDPAHTKTFNRAGGFCGTAVNQAYQTRRATELFGPIGIGWGFDELEHQIVEGAGGDKVWFSKVKLWYQHDGRRGEVVQWGATTFVGKNKNGPFTDEEAGKKSITDAVGKCLSLLGFSADVYLGQFGQFDDQKYVNDRRREEAERKAEGRRQKAAIQNPPSAIQNPVDPDLAAFRDAIAAATSIGAAKQAEQALRAARMRSGQPLSEIESALVASCTEAACQRIRESQKAEGRRQKAEGGGIDLQQAANGKPANGHAPVPPSLRPSASPSPQGPVSGAHLMQPRGAGTAHPHDPKAEGRRQKAEGQNPNAQRPTPNAQLAPDVAAFREFCEQALTTVDVKRGEHVLRSKRLRDRIGMGDAESELIAGWADAACRRIRAARRSR
jgi:hypothetical protein